MGYLFFSADREGNRVEFSPEETRHAIKVLRLKPGDSIQFTDGKGMLFEGKVSDIQKDRFSAAIVSEQMMPPAFPFSLHLAVSPLKNPDRFEWLLEKAIELGISSFTPVICQRTEKTNVKAHRLEQIVLSASKQSLQYHFPKLHEPVPLADFFSGAASGSRWIAHCYETPKKSIREISPVESYTLLIGPEGDFTEQEIALATAEGFEPLSLGTKRLRTETAGVYATAAIHILHTFGA